VSLKIRLASALARVPQILGGPASGLRERIAPRGRRGLGIAAALLCGVLGSAGGPGAPATGAESLQIVSPGPTGIATHNQRDGASPTTVSIEDAKAEIRPGPLTITGIAKGMRNVAVIVPAGGAWTMAQPGADGRFTAEVTIPDAAGPLPIETIAWNSPPNDPHYTVELKARVLLFVAGGKRESLPSRPPPGHPAEGLSLAWSDDFTAPLSFSSARVRNAVWFAGGKPSATGSQYSDATFVRADDPRNPFFQKDGFLRIRASSVPAPPDAPGGKARWWSGHLSSGFPDGTASIELREGYVEARMMIPEGRGPWPAFWMLDSASTPAKSPYGAVEIDVMEGYGHDIGAYMATIHRWPGPDPKEPHASAEKRVPIPGNPNAFHTYGARITRTEVIWYLDGAEVQRAPLYRANVVSPFYLMLDLAMGGGWPDVVPPAGHYDLWIDHVAVYR
jgi:hypothetical protein